LNKPFIIFDVSILHLHASVARLQRGSSFYSSRISSLSLHRRHDPTTKA
jgi:hypothetical protein